MKRTKQVSLANVESGVMNSAKRFQSAIDGIKKIEIKTFFVLTGLFFLLSTAIGQPGQFQQNMGEALQQYAAAQTTEDFQQAANKFQTIGMAAENQWLPYYYATLAYVDMSFRSESSKRDPLLDQAQENLDKAMKLKADEPENLILQGYLYQGRIQVNPMMRGQKYATMAAECFQKALAIDQNNPRAYFLLGMNYLNTPKAFGGGPDKAKPLFEKAEEKFTSFVPESPLYPGWGKEMNEAMLKKCE